MSVHSAHNITNSLSLSLSSCRVFGIPFYVGLLAPFLAIYLFNWIVFAVIIFNLLCKDCLARFKESHTSEKKMSIKQQLVIAITLSILFGLGWGIGLPATQELHQTPAVRDTFAAFFIILTAFQGLFVFVMHCLRSKEARKLWSQWILKTTGKEVDLSLSLSSQSSYWRQRKQQMRNKSTSTYASYISSSGTLRKMAVDISIDTEGPGLEGDHIAPISPISPCSNVAYELPQLTEREHSSSHPSITSKESECNGTQVYKEPVVITETEDKEEMAGEKEEKKEKEDDEGKKAQGAKEREEAGDEAKEDEVEEVEVKEDEVKEDEAEGKEVVVEEGQQDSPVITTECGQLPDPTLHSDSGNGGVINGAVINEGVVNEGLVNGITSPP